MSDNEGEQEVHEWSAFYDDEGRVYYYNGSTGESSWDPPEKFNPPPPPEGGEHEANSEDSDPREASVEEPFDQNVEEPEADEPEPDEQEPDEQEPDEPAPLEEPKSSSSSAWVAYQDDEGREYYFNTETEETTWERPDDFVQVEPQPDMNEEPSSPTRLPSPSSDMDEQPDTPEEDAPEEEPVEDPEEMEPEEEEEQIDPAAKRLEEAEKALNQTDAIMEPAVMTHVTEVVSSESGNPQKAIQALSESYYGQTAACGLLARWLADLKAQSATSDPTEQPKHFDRAADEIRQMTQDVVNRISKERFTKTGGDSILNLSRSEATFLEDMMDSNRWRKLLIDLSATNKDSALLMYCLQAISKRGHHREIARRINQSDHFAVFNAMLSSELAVVGKIAVSACRENDTSISLSELVGDLHRTCTATAYTYLYAIEVLRHLVIMAQNRPEWKENGNFALYSRAIRKWERLNEDLHGNMMDPSASAGSTPLFRKRRLDVAATISELHQRQRRRLLPTDNESSSVYTNGSDDRRSKVETAVLNFMKRYSMGTRVDDRILDAMLPEGVGGDPSNLIGKLLIQSPLTIKALLGYMYKPGSNRVASPVTRNKCARLVAFATLAAEEEALTEAKEAGKVLSSESDEVTMSRWLSEGSQLCERLEQVVSFLVSVGENKTGARLSPGEQLCSLAIKCPPVTMGVAIWAKEYTKGSEFAASASYGTLAPSVMSLLRVLYIHHSFIRDDVLSVAFGFIVQANPEEISYQRIIEIKEQSLRLLLFLAARGEAPTVLVRIRDLLNQGTSSLDASLVRYFVSGLLEIAEAPFSIPFTRSLCLLLQTPGCIEAVRTSYFGEENKSRLAKIIEYFKTLLTDKKRELLTPEDAGIIRSTVSTYAA